jgi:hypothetical protein
VIAWQNFYILVGTAAATLIGLMFVAITFGASMMGKIENPDTTRAFIDPTLTHFVQVLLTSCFMLVPSFDPRVLGALLAAIAIFRVAALARVHRHMRAAHQRNNDLELSDWMQGIVIPLAMHVLLAACGALFIAGFNALPTLLLAIVTLVVLLNGIYGAWELVVWIALTRSQKDE